MHPGHHHLHSRHQPRGHQGRVAVGAGNLHGLQPHRAGVRLVHPHRRALALAQQGVGGQVHGRGQAAAVCSVQHHGGGGAQRRRGGAGAVNGHLDRVGARDRVGAGRHLAHPARQRRLAGPQAHLHRLARRQLRQPVFGHCKLHVARAVHGNAQHRCAGRDHLARLGQHRRHHAVHAGHQARVGGLVALRAGLGARLLQRRLGRAQPGLAALQLGAADEVLFFQRRVAPGIGRRQVTLCLRGRHLGLRGLRGQPVVLWVQFGQQLAGAHPLAQFGRAPRQLAAHLKTQAGLGARPHFAGVLVLRLHRPGPDGDELDRAHRLGQGFWLGAARQQHGRHGSGHGSGGSGSKRDGTRPGKPRPGQRHSVRMAHEKIH